MVILIWEARDKQKITLSQLSKMTGISTSALDDYENSIRFPRIDKLERIAKALECRITDLFESEYK
ncbi:MAG TPA: XRE family transcriptional regulator [Clostridium sp.]|nr:XRE family transcriptional regulator [Clostridium sp.]